MIQRVLAIWSLVPLPFLNPAWTCGSSWFMKPGLENFEHYFTSVWGECNCAIVWAFFGIAFLWNWNENWSFPVLWPLLSWNNSHGSNVNWISLEKFNYEIFQKCKKSIADVHMFITHIFQMLPGICYAVNVCVAPKFICWCPKPQKWWHEKTGPFSHERGGTLMNGINVLKTETL